MKTKSNFFWSYYRCHYIQIKIVLVHLHKYLWKFPILLLKKKKTFRNFYTYICTSIITWAKSLILVMCPKFCKNNVTRKISAFSFRSRYLLSRISDQEKKYLCILILQFLFKFEGRPVDYPNVLCQINMTQNDTCV